MQEKITQLIENINKVIVGKRDVVELLCLSFFCQGHVLIEDVPGTGKTTLAIALSRSIGGSFNRVSCTPDVMPSDITGFTMFNPSNHQFEYHEGAIMANVFLADEINRTPPKTQSGLLEAMEENHVTVDGKIYDLPKPFIVIATQNPVEYLGTYPLPEAQMDRFMTKLSIGYPSFNEELQIMKRFNKSGVMESIQPVISFDDIENISNGIDDIAINDQMARYIIQLVQASRESKDTLLGISPRGGLFLTKMAKAKAYFDGRTFVIPDDVKDVFLHVCAHRIVAKPEVKYENRSNEDILSDIMKSVKVPEGGFSV